MARNIARTIFVLVAGAFVWLMGLVSMTGVNLSNASDMAFFLVFNGLVLVGVIAALRQVWAKPPDPADS